MRNWRRSPRLAPATHAATTRWATGPQSPRNQLAAKSAPDPAAGPARTSRSCAWPWNAAGARGQPPVPAVRTRGSRSTRWIHTNTPVDVLLPDTLTLPHTYRLCKSNPDHPQASSRVRRRSLPSIVFTHARCGSPQRLRPAGRPGAPRPRKMSSRCTTPFQRVRSSRLRRAWRSLRSSFPAGFRFPPSCRASSSEESPCWA